jgi:ribosomal subunit interface protein
MHIQFNTDNHINGSQAMKVPLEEMIEKSLERFGERITRVEVHLNDTNSHKSGINDKECTMEVRLKGMSPVAVRSQADNNHSAVRAAIDKAKHALDNVIGKISRH